jgi:fatty-acyl-CoA synthase
MVDPRRWASEYARRVGHIVEDVQVLGRAGLFRPVGPQQLRGMAQEVRRWGLSAPAVYGLAAVRTPNAEAAVDNERRITFAELNDRSNALANALAEDALAGGRVGLLGRNSVHFVEATAALAKLGSDTLFLNTGFAGPQLKEVAEREGLAALIHDDDFGPLVQSSGLRLPSYSSAEIDALMARGDPSAPPPPARQGQPVILTSGTTGTPKGAARAQPTSIEPLLALLARIPYRAGDRLFVAAPLFHSWGLAHLMSAHAMSSTVVLRRRFDPTDALVAIEAEKISVLVVVPSMLQRIMDLPVEVRRRYDTSTLRVIACSGSALPGPLATQVMDAFGDVLYNLYGSTEVGWVSIATPVDLREAPGTAGVAARGVLVRLLSADGTQVKEGEEGRIFVGSELLFDGYTDGGSKELHDGFMCTGDVGRFDAAGRLFISGREDDMIVSGGENVFPGEVEDVVLTMDGVADAAVVGVPDDQFGQRLRAYVVRRPGATLTAEDVQAVVRSRLARFKVPRDVAFVDELPRNATGKILRRQLG